MKSIASWIQSISKNESIKKNYRLTGFVGVSITLIAAASTVPLLPTASMASGIAFDRGGNLFFKGLNADTIFKFAPDGTKTAFAISSDEEPLTGSIAVDAAGNIYACTPKSILKFAPDGSKSVFATDIGKFWAYALAVDANGNVFLPTEDGILKFTTDGKRTTFATGVQVYGMAFDRSGNLFATNSYPENGHLVRSILKFAPDGAKSTFARDGGYSLAFDKSGNLFVASEGIIKFIPDGKKSSFAKAGGSNGLAFDPGGNLIACDGNDRLSKITPDGKRLTFEWRESPGGEQQQGEDSADGLSEKYAKSYLISRGTLSPNKKIAIIYPTEDSEDFPGGANYIVALKPFSILGKLNTNRPYFAHESNAGLSADWSDDGSVALVTLDAKWGPGDVYVLEFKDGKLARATNLLSKLREQLMPDYRKLNPNRHVEDDDFLFESEDKPMFELDGSTHVQINALATNNPKDFHEKGSWSGRFEGVWYIPSAKFTSQKVSRVKSEN